MLRRPNCAVCMLPFWALCHESPSAPSLHRMKELDIPKASHLVLATSDFVDERTRVLKHGDTFAVLDHCGGMRPGGLGEEGLYHESTRFLSQLSIHLEGHRLFFLGPTFRGE